MPTMERSHLVTSDLTPAHSTSHNFTTVVRRALGRGMSFIFEGSSWYTQCTCMMNVTNVKCICTLRTFLLLSPVKDVHS